MARLRAETRASHKATEQTVFSRAIAAGEITRHAYATQLAAYRDVLEVLEARLADAADPRIRAVFDEGMRRVPTLKSDLAALVAEDEAVPAGGLPSVEAYRKRLSSPLATASILLGHLYVFEGSSLGSAFLLPRLTASLGLTAETSRYYHGHGERTMAHWKAFGARMDAALTGEEEQDEAVAAALEAFVRIAEIFEDIEKTRSPSASRLMAPLLATG